MNKKIELYKLKLMATFRQVKICSSLSKYQVVMQASKNGFCLVKKNKPWIMRKASTLLLNTYMLKQQQINDFLKS